MKLDCQTCTDQQKGVRGCEEETGQLYIEGEIHVRCPQKTIPYEMYEYLSAFNMHKAGFLPNGGSWLDESSKYLEAMSIVEREVNKIESDRITRISKNGKR